jgi:predicted membrane protein
MGLVGYAILQIIAPLVNTHTFLGITIQAGTAGLGALVTYASLAYFLGLPEAKQSFSYIFKLFQKR